MKEIEILSPIQQLDRVLLYFAEHGIVGNVPSGIDVSTLLVLLNQNTECFSEPDLYKVLNKLEQDNFIAKNIVGKYSVTWDGRYFMVTESGYGNRLHQNQIKRNAENIRVAKLENHQMRHQTTLNWLTFFVALGTLVAAWYYMDQLNLIHHWW